VDFFDLQRNWNAFGRLDPFWAILTDPSRRGNKWDPAEFFATGQEEVAALFEHAARLGVPAQRTRALDFGCGAGRLTQALATYVESAVGVDIAPSMIDLARRHNAHGSRCHYQTNSRPDLVDFPNGFFDIVYTGRVLQHMEPRYAELYVREFVRVLSPGGYLSFDLPSEYGNFPTSAPGSQSPGAYRFAVRFLSVPRRVACGQRVSVLADVTNDGSHTWQHGQLNVGNHWARQDGSVVVRDDARSGMTLPWAPGHSREVELTVTAPLEPGQYRLQCDVVEEGVTWFAEAGSVLAEADVLVGTSATSPAAPDNAADDHEEPLMEMHAVKRDRVEQLLTDAQARLLGVRRVYHCGPTWLAFRYDVTRP
jgi:SAM-dependent methyltransferase